MSHVKGRFTLAASLGLIVLIAGCGGRDLPDRAKVNGTVTLNGAPLEGAVVNFMPADEEGRPATGTTDAEGNFSLTTFNTGDGAIPAQYKVGVTKVKAEEMNPDEAANPSMFMERTQASPDGNKRKSKKDENLLLPAKFTSPQTSGLQYLVEADKTNTFEIDLKE